MSDAARRCDVAIVGGGMVGASLALALAGTRLKVTLIEAIEASSAEMVRPRPVPPYLRVVDVSA